MKKETVMTLTTLLSAIVWLAFAPTSSAADLPSYDRVRVLETAREVSDAELTNQDGDAFQLSELRGRVAFVFFGFTNCPDVCPLTMQKFRLLNESGQIDPKKVAFVLVSVDGERDTPDVIKAFLGKFSPDIIGLTGDPGLVKPIAKEFSASFYKGNPTGSDGHYSMMHSPQAFVLDPAGQLRAELYSPTVEAMAGIANALLEDLD